MFGGFDAWLVSSLGGLDSAVVGERAGWRDIVVRVTPAAIATLRKGSVAHNTRFGLASVSWAFESSSYSVNITVPIGSNATVHIPTLLPMEHQFGMHLSQVQEGRHELWPMTPVDWPVGVLSLVDGSHELLARLGSGRYAFVASYDERFEFIL